MTKILDQQLKYLKREGFEVWLKDGDITYYRKPQKETYISYGRVIGHYEVKRRNTGAEDIIMGIVFVSNGQNYNAMDLETIYHYTKAIYDVLEDIELGWGFKYGL